MIDLLKDYLEKRLELFKLNAAEKTFSAVGTSVPVLILCLLFMFFIFLLNIGLALLIGIAVSNYAYGFLILAGAYLLLMLLVLAFRKTIKNLVVNKAIKTLFKD